MHSVRQLVVWFLDDRSFMYAQYKRAFELKKIKIKYFSTKIFLITDLQKMFELIFEYFDGCQICIEEMSKCEQDSASEISRGIQLVKNNFYIYEVKDSEVIRVPELEKRIIYEGQK